MTTSSPAARPPSTSSQSPPSTPSADRAPLHLRRRCSDERRSACRSLIWTRRRRDDRRRAGGSSTTIAPRPYMPGRSSPARLSSCTSASSVRVAGIERRREPHDLARERLARRARRPRRARPCPTATPASVALVDGDEHAQHVDARDGEDGAAARRADERARVEAPLRDHAVERRRRSASRRGAPRARRSAPWPRPAAASAVASAALRLLQLLLRDHAARARAARRARSSCCASAARRLRLRQRAARGGQLIGQIARPHQREELPLLHRVAAIDQHGVEVAERLRPDVGLRERPQIDGRADLHRHVPHLDRRHGDERAAGGSAPRRVPPLQPSARGAARGDHGQAPGDEDARRIRHVYGLCNRQAGDGETSHERRRSGERRGSRAGVTSTELAAPASAGRRSAAEQRLEPLAGLARSAPAPSCPG